MKKCPTCDKTFDDGMRFCQTDGTALVEAADAAKQDPFKTTVGNQDEIASAIPLDPFKTMVAPPMKDEREILELPEEPDFLKTMVSQPKEIQRSEPANKDNAKINITPSSPFDDAPPPEILDAAESDDQSNLINSEVSPPQNDSDYLSKEQNPSNQSPYENPYSSPIPSPFEESMLGYEAPSKPLPFEDPFPRANDPFQSPLNQTPSPLEVEEVKAEALNTPYAEQVENQVNQPLEQANWTPPPAPDADWQNRQIGQNTPFQPPPAGQGQNQTLAIVSLVLGVLSMLCCVSVITGPAGLVTGFMAKKNAEQNPNEYGGRGLALGGIITGGIGTFVFIILFILQTFFGILGGILGNI